MGEHFTSCPQEGRKGLKLKSVLAHLNSLNDVFGGAMGRDEPREEGDNGETFGKRWARTQQSQCTWKWEEGANWGHIREVPLLCLGFLVG